MLFYLYIRHHTVRIQNGLSPCVLMKTDFNVPPDESMNYCSPYRSVVPGVHGQSKVQSTRLGRQ